MVPVHLSNTRNKRNCMIGVGLPSSIDPVSPISTPQANPGWIYFESTSEWILLLGVYLCTLALFPCFRVKHLPRRTLADLWLPVQRRSGYLIQTEILEKYKATEACMFSNWWWFYSSTGSRSNLAFGLTRPLRPNGESQFWSCETLKIIRDLDGKWACDRKHLNIKVATFKYFAHLSLLPSDQYEFPSTDPRPCGICRGSSNESHYPSMWSWHHPEFHNWN